MSLDLSALSELNLNTPKGKKLLDNLISEKHNFKYSLSCLNDRISASINSSFIIKFL